MFSFDFPVGRDLANIGVLGGSFDPIHAGHLVLGEGVREGVGLDKVIFLPANIPPHKSAVGRMASPEDRLNMVRLAVGDNPFFEASDLEIARSGTSYTIDTVRGLKRQYYGGIYLIVGGDSVGELKTWKDARELMRECKLAVGRRPGFELPSAEELERELGVHGEELLSNVVDIPQVGVSSTDIRRRVREGKSVKYLVPDRVRAYIEERGLYRDAGGVS